MCGGEVNDRATDVHLEGLGWTVLRFWEHEDPIVAVAALVVGLESQVPSIYRRQAPTLRDVYKFTDEEKKEFNGEDRYVPITYKEKWGVVREVAEKSGTPFNKRSYEAEAKREAEALERKKAQQQPPKN